MLVAAICGLLEAMAYVGLEVSVRGLDGGYY